MLAIVQAKRVAIRTLIMKPSHEPPFLQRLNSENPTRGDLCIDRYSFKPGARGAMPLCNERLL
jgi:hypothetical protein